MRHGELLINALFHRWGSGRVYYWNRFPTNPPSGGQVSGLFNKILITA
jgi:hypothetical protein